MCDGYERTKFEHWIDEDKDGCNTRAEALLAEAVTEPSVGADSKITGGACSERRLRPSQQSRSPKGCISQDPDHSRASRPGKIPTTAILAGQQAACAVPPEDEEPAGELLAEEAGVLLRARRKAPDLVFCRSGASTQPSWSDGRYRPYIPVSPTGIPLLTSASGPVTDPSRTKPAHIPGRCRALADAIRLLHGLLDETAGLFPDAVQERDRHRLLPPRRHTSPSRGTRQGRLTPAYVPRWPAVLADAWPSRVAVSLEEVSRIEHGGDGLDLDELVLVTERGDAHQRAGDVMVGERVPDYLPGGHQVLPPRRCDENPCADDILE